jgi:CheY-like chemotaxis protein
MKPNIREIYLIDDDSDDQELFVTALSQLNKGVSCKTESNGLTALDHLTNQRIVPDIIFVDLNMPLLNGFEFLEFMQQSYKHKPIPVIVYSTTSDHASRQKSKALGAYDFITKPNTFDGLTSMLEHVLGKMPAQKI